MAVISRVRVYSHCNDLGGKLWNPAIRWTRKFAIFVIIEDEDGNEGLGECWCFDSAPDTLVTYLRTEVLPQLVGVSLDAADTACEQLLRRATLTARHGLLASAISGIDMALWDLRSQRLAKPLWQCLNLKGTGAAPLYASGGLYGQDKQIPDLVDEMVALQSRGFSILKMKVGGLSIDEDLSRVQAVLNATSADTKLIIDGVYSYAVSDALSLYPSLPAERIEAFQSPVAAHDLAGMAALVAASVPVMGTEAEYRVEVHRELVDKQAVQFLQVAPVACGGFSRLQQLSDIIVPTPIKLSLEVSSTAVAFMAACHYAAAYPSVAHVEYHTVHQVFFDNPFMPAINIQDGRYNLPDTVGLGMSLPVDEVTPEFVIERE